MSRMRKSHRSSHYLVAEPAGFPGLRIPLLSDEECEARGIEKPKWPALKTWTPEQQRAARELTKIMMDCAIFQALKILLTQIEELGSDGCPLASQAEIEQEAARRGLELLKRRRWKPGPDDWGGLEELMHVALETIARGVPAPSG